MEAPPNISLRCCFLAARQAAVEAEGSIDHMLFGTLPLAPRNPAGGCNAAPACGLAVLRVMREERLQENAAAVGAYCLARLRELQVRARLGSDTRLHPGWLGSGQVVLSMPRACGRLPGRAQEDYPSSVCGRSACQSRPACSPGQRPLPLAGGAPRPGWRRARRGPDAWH